MAECILQYLIEKVNDENSLFGTKSWKPPVIAEYDSQSRRVINSD